MTDLEKQWMDYFETNGFKTEYISKPNSEYCLYLPELDTRIALKRIKELTDEQLDHYARSGKRKNTLVILGRKFDRHNWYYFGEERHNPLGFIQSID